MSNLPSPGFFSSQINRGKYLVSDVGRDACEDLRVVCAGWEDCSPEYRIQRDDFPYYALEFIAGGRWELTSRGRKRQLGPGSVFTYGPGVAYSLRPLGKTGLSKYFVDFSGHAADRFTSDFELDRGADGMVLQHRWLRDLFDQLIETRAFSATAQRRLARLTLELMLTRLPEHLKDGEQKTQAWVTFERCRAFLAENYLRSTRLSHAARDCGVAPAYLSRLFARFSNESPKAFVDRMKMNHAAQKLLRGNLQVKEAASEVGYADVFHFSRVFKKRFGVAPSVFARRGRPSDGGNGAHE